MQLLDKDSEGSMMSIASAHASGNTRCICLLWWRFGPACMHVPCLNASCRLAGCQAWTILIASIYNNTTRLGNAYGVCVMFVTFFDTCMVTLVAVMVWRFNPWLVALPWLVIACMDGTFLSSALTKVPDPIHTFPCWVHGFRPGLPRTRHNEEHSRKGIPGGKGHPHRYR